VSIATNGAVNVTGVITLTQNPDTSNPLAPVTYQNGIAPTISIASNTLTVAAGGSINSQINTGANPCQICGQSACQNTVAIIAPTVVNNGTLAGNFINLVTSNLTNTGNITGNGSNAMILITSPTGTGLTVAGTGNMTVPLASVIQISAADNQALQLNGSQTYTTGGSSLVIFGAQAAGGNITFGAGTTQTIAGGPIVSISSPSITLGSGASVMATGASLFAINAGYTANALTITAPSGGTGKIVTGSGGAISMRPVDGQNISIVPSGTDGARLDFGTTTPLMATAGGGKTNISRSVRVSNKKIVTNPAGDIYGIAFEPYVGGLSPVGSGNTFTLFGAYTYPQTLLLMAPIAATQQFQVLATYNSGIVADSTAPSGYSQQGAARFVIGAAKQLGLRVSAGVGFQPDGPGTALGIPGTQADINATMLDVAKYGNVIDIVVGNECIDPDNLTGPGGSITNLGQLITYAQNNRPAGFANLPVSTRQRHDLMSSANILNTGGLSTVLNSLGANGYVYANIYPYYDNLFTAPIPPTTQSQFNTIVIADMNAQYNGLVTAFKGATTPVTIDIRIGETGWAVNPAQQPPPSAIAQATVQFATWYYPAMQKWSATTTNGMKGGTGVKIGGWFEGFDEPWKVNPSAPSQAGEPFFGIWTATGTTSSIGTYTLTGFTQKYALPIYVPPTGQSSVAPPVSDETTVFKSLATNEVSSSNSTTLNEQIGSKLPTDTTPTPQDQNTDHNPPNLNIANNATAYSSPEAAGDGWKQSDDGIWSCSGCLGSSGQKSESAIRLLQKIAGDSSVTLIAQAQPAGPLQSSSSKGSDDMTIFDLPRGVALFNAQNHVVCGTQEGHVHIEKGSMAFVVETGNDVCVYNLHDTKDGGVRVLIGKQMVTVPPGRQLVLTRREAEFAQVNPGTKIGYRNPKPLKLDGDVKAFVADFSITGAVYTIPPLKAMLKSPKASERRAANAVLKNAIVMQDLTAAAGPYTKTK
jgi:hypothetical protein